MSRQDKKARIREIKKRLAGVPLWEAGGSSAATLACASPLSMYENGIYVGSWESRMRWDVYGNSPTPQGYEQAEFIAHAPHDIKFLLSEISKLKRELNKEKKRSAILDCLPYADY